MQTQLAPQFQNTPEGRQAEAILRKCVHCGFCTATCPTYQLLGDELDGPRGRIYLIKQVLEGQTPTRKTQLHLDRCLTCRNCESTCPSGVQYGHLVDIGRKLVDEQVPRPLGERAVRWALKEGLPSPLFAPAMKIGQAVRGLLPASLQAKVPHKQPAGEFPTRSHARKMLMLEGCVQPAMMPNINTATARVLDAAGIETVAAAKAGCCGAVKFHLNDQIGAKAEMRRNIDAWWPFVEQGVEAIVMNASGCGATVKDYGFILRDDPAYADKAERISALTRDLSELLPDITAALKDRLPRSLGAGTDAGAGAGAGAGVKGAPKLVFHPPCTLQHGQQLRGSVEKHLGELGFEIRLASCEAHLCCGSAGTYSVLNPEISCQLRDRKLANLAASQDAAAPEVIVSANIGCITHLQSGTQTPVRHWVEVLDAALAGQ
jgi:glycolate oxidase iron-sulfur subunit